MTGRREAFLLRLALCCGALVVVACFLLKPLNDPDFFWHLKTGAWIWEHRELPDRDPFNYRSAEVDPSPQRFVLTSYWLSQLGYHALHAVLGMPGIVLVKLLVALGLAGALLALRRGDPVTYEALALVVLLLLAAVYPFDRPQVFSFVLFAALLFLLERARSGAPGPAGWRAHLPVALLMLAWANLHGGHAVGQVLIAATVALEGVKFLHPALRPAGRDAYRRLLLSGAGGLAASLLNPNGWQALAVAGAPAPAWMGLADYVSTARFFREMHQPVIAVVWGAMALAAASCLSSRARPDLTRLALLAGTGYYGFVHTRYAPYFVICALPVAGELLSAGRGRTWMRRAVVGGAIGLVAFIAKDEVPTRERLSAALRVNEALYPVRAADFILANGLQGNLYNTHVWGGYLLWRLGPERRVFVDGRGINPEATVESASINMAFARPGEAVPYWEGLLERYGVGHLVLPAVGRRGGLIYEDTARLARALLADPDWALVLADDTALVFVRDLPGHRGVIARHRLAAGRPFGWWLRDGYERGNQLVSLGLREEAAAAYREALGDDPRNAEAWHNLGCVLGELGRMDEAAAALREALRLRPDHPTARRNLGQIPAAARRPAAR